MNLKLTDNLNTHSNPTAVTHKKEKVKKIKEIKCYIRKCYFFKFKF